MKVSVGQRKPGHQTALSSGAQEDQELSGASVPADQDRTESSDARTEPTAAGGELKSQSRIRFQGANQDPNGQQ